MTVKSFRTPAELRKWFDKNHTTADELIVGYYKKGSGKPSVTWPESVDEALCVGWIDGIRRKVDDVSYTIRFTPRRTGSIWSAVNIKRVEVLTGEGRMRPAGLKAIEARKANKSGIYAYEQRSADLIEPYAAVFKRHKAAWTFHQQQPPGYRKQVHWWVTSAKTEETRLKRLQKLIDEAKAGRRVE